MSSGALSHCIQIQTQFILLARAKTLNDEAKIQNGKRHYATVQQFLNSSEKIANSNTTMTSRDETMLCIEI